MGKNRKNSKSARISRKWIIVFFVGVFLITFKLITNRAMVQVNIVQKALKISALDISAPQFSVDHQALLVKTKGIWDVPHYLLPHSKRTVQVEHLFRGFDYTGMVTYSDVLGHDRTFSVTKVGKSIQLAFDKLFYRGAPNILVIDPGIAIFQDGKLQKVKSSAVKLTTDGQLFIGENMVMSVGVDPHELTLKFDRLTFEKQTIENITLVLNTNILIPGIKKLELTHVEGKGTIKDTTFDFMWSETKDEDDQLKLTGYGTIPMAFFKSILIPMKKRMLQTERMKVVASQDKMKLMRFDLLKKLHLNTFEKQFVTRFIPIGYFRKDKTFFHFDIRPEAPLAMTPQPKNAETYFKLAKTEPEKSVRYLRNSCGLGHPEACFKLGMLSQKSIDGKLATNPFFELACSLKHKESCKKVKLLSIND